MRYKKLTPPAENYPLFGKTPLVVADILARFYGWEKPVMVMKPVDIKEL